MTSPGRCATVEPMKDRILISVALVTFLAALALALWLMLHYDTLPAS